MSSNAGVAAAQKGQADTAASINAAEIADMGIEEGRSAMIRAPKESPEDAPDREASTGIVAATMEIGAKIWEVRRTSAVQGRNIRPPSMARAAEWSS